MSFNRVCDCSCSDIDDGGGGGELCQGGECPDVFGLDVVVPATKCHYGKIASANCCGFNASSWSHSLSMTSYSNCGAICHWWGKLQTPHCISETTCGFPFNSMTPDVSCYDSPAAIFKGCDHPTTAQANGTTQCTEPSIWHGDLGICQCNVGNGPCVGSGIGTVYRNPSYTLHTHSDPKVGTICYRCGCNAVCGHTLSACPSGEEPCGELVACSCCPIVMPACSDHTTDGFVLYAGGLTTRLHSSLRYGPDFYPGGNYGTRFYLTVHVSGFIFYSGQMTNCLGEWGNMVSNYGNCTNFCCTENPSDSCPMWDSTGGQSSAQQCGFVGGNCAGGFDDVNTYPTVIRGTYQTWGLPTDITPANCLDLRGVTQSTSGVVMVQDYDRVDLDTFQYQCARTALDGDDNGRMGYFGVSKEFSPSWTVT